MRVRAIGQSGIWKTRFFKAVQSGKRWCSGFGFQRLRDMLRAVVHFEIGSPPFGFATVTIGHPRLFKRLGQR